MKCALCDGKLVEAKGRVAFGSRALGHVDVPSLEFLECIDCGDTLLSPEMSEKAVDFIERKEQEAVAHLPIGQFITAGEAAGILDVSKQAFSKNPRVKKGLIFSRKIGERRYYDRKSVELFKEKRNGKYKLPAAGLVLGRLKKERILPDQIGNFNRVPCSASHATTIVRKRSHITVLPNFNWATPSTIRRKRA